MPDVPDMQDESTPDSATGSAPGSSSAQPPEVTVAAFQKYVRDRYYATDSARGAPGTYLWFIEEVGELAHAIANRERGRLDRANLEEEFADVLAWLTTLANVCDVDLTKAIHDKYLKTGGPEGYKT